jgi:hypothetical protein
MMKLMPKISRITSRLCNAFAILSSPRFTKAKVVNTVKPMTRSLRICERESTVSYKLGNFVGEVTKIC